MTGGDSGETASKEGQEEEGERVGRALLLWTPYDILRRSRGAIWDLPAVLGGEAGKCTSTG